ALRIFNAYGPCQSLPLSHAPVVPRFLQQVLTGGSLVVFGNGRQTRDFVYVSDVVAALTAAATAKDINRQVINIGSGVETSIDQLVALMKHVTGCSGNVIYNTEKSGGVPRLVADISRARMLLGYQPLVSLEEGLRRMLTVDPRFQQ
ncbi:MAG: GDP-mannose 4,6-dehydratase, partial [Ardenticatenaceae bacterium]|nr:GDP-mannose 4,6-dehydratase [Ardenticatenaceae bacterium]